MNKFTKFAVCAVLTASMGMTALTGCDKQLNGTETVATCGEDQVSLGTANMVLRINQVQMESYYAMMGATGSALWNQPAEEGKTYGDEQKEQVMDLIHEMVLLKQHATDYDVELTEEEKTAITDAAKAFVEANTEKDLKNLLVSQADIESLLTLYTYQTKMYDPMVADVDTNVEDSEAAQKKVTYTRFSIADTTDKEGNTAALTDEEKQAKKDLAQKLLDTMNGQEDSATADMDALAKEIDENAAALTTTFGKEDGLVDQEIRDAVEGLEDGTMVSAIIETNNAYIVARLDSNFDQEATDSKKVSIVKDRKDEAYKALLDEWKEKAGIKVDQKLWDEMKLDGIDTYTVKQKETEE